ncbi:AAA family ATPase [Lysobacter sp. KIS68-7]|uniref:ATP-binding protein n=1 Tax=Lysobacter sp. KIS68-7 TaxID=2904252 RepID=UPI001E50AF25|nr:AAA family ATPase [Lysobacter sp. KIS68-7]UHQ19397.1 AAA family ATPase [Lysobacter sp. KIS68-7]
MAVNAAPDPLHVRFGEFELDQGNARLLRAGSPVALAPTPFELLCALARQPGAMLTKHALLDVVWGHRFVSDSVLKGAISDIRNALEDDPRQPRFIETVPRRGYRFVGRPVVMQPAAPGELAVAGEHRTGHDVDGAKGSGFVGRDAELSALERAWERANTGRRTLAWVAGEPGIGKTTLVEHFIAGFDEVSCARGSCVQSFGAGEPYHAVLEALSELGRRDDAVVPMLRDIAPTWLLQLPWLTTAEVREALQRELVGVHPERMLRELGEFLDRYTEHRPLLLVTEDLHWADRATTQLIDYVARRRGSARFMWLATFRLTEVIAMDHPLGALRHELRLAGLCEEIVLDSFSERETAAFLAARAPALAEDGAFVRALHDRTEGVPLFVASIADDVAARVRKGGVPVGELSEIPLPQGLSALIDHYLGRLDAGRRALLGAASVCGTRFRVETLATVLERDVLDVSDTCDALVREQGWLVATPESQQGLETSDDYAFRHALYRQAVLDRTTLPVRVELHRRIALALERERDAGADVTASALAAHFDQGRQPMSALGHYAEAAQAALQHLRPGECLALSERALVLIDQVEAGPARAAHELTLGTLRGIAAFQALGAGQVSRDAFARAAARLGETPDHPMRGLLLHGFGFLLNLRAEYDEALLTAARAEALGEATDDALLIVAAGTVQGQAHMAQGRHEAARRALERILPAVASLEEASETRLLGFIADPQVTARAMLSVPLVHLGLVQQARAHLDAAHARARSLGQPMAVMVAIWLDALVEVRLGNAERVASLAAEMLALVEEYALAQGRLAGRFFQGWAESRLGQPREGYRRIREACDENVALGMLSGTTETLTYAAEALIAAGDYEAAQANLDEALVLVERHDERICMPQLHLIDAAIARHRSNQGRADAAVRSAVKEARVQASPWLELLALTTLVEQGIPVAEDIDALAALVARLVEAQDTPLVARARALLAGRLPHS